MKNMHPLIALMLLAVICLVAGCKKETDGNTPEISLEKQTYYQLEIAQLKHGDIPLTDSIYSGTIGSTTVQLSRQHGQLVFVVPMLGPGSFTLNVSIDNREYSANFSVVATPPTNGTVAFNQLIQDLSETSTMLQSWADTLPAGETAQWTSEITAIQHWADSLQQQYNSLNPEQQQQFADFYAANQWWLNEVQQAITVLHNQARTFKTNDDITDYDAKVEAAMYDFVQAKIKVIQHIPKVAALSVAGGLLGSAFPIVGTAAGAVLGAAVGVLKFSSDFAVLKSAIVSLINTSFIPFQNIVSNGKTHQSHLNLISNVPKQFKVTMEYRSAYVADDNSTIPVVADFVNGLKEIRTNWNNLTGKLPAWLFPPSVVADRPTYRTGLVEVHSKYLTIDDWDPGDFTIQQLTKQNGFFIINLLNNTTQTLYPTYRITYSHPKLGNIIDYGSVSIDPFDDNTCGSQVTDIDGNVYPIVRIGGMCWMGENLRTSRFRNGEPIQQLQVESFYTVSETQTPGWAYYNNDASNNATYGKLYNGYAMSDGRKVCPTGWHVPTLFEFQALRDSLGGAAVAGDKMKTIDLWNAPASPADNASGFSAVPTGYIGFNASYDKGVVTEFWTSTWPNFPTGDETFTAKLRNTDSDLNLPSMAGNAGNEWNAYGLPIRCVRD